MNQPGHLLGTQPLPLPRSDATCFRPSPLLPPGSPSLQWVPSLFPTFFLSLAPETLWPLACSLMYSKCHKSWAP